MFLFGYVVGPIVWGPGEFTRPAIYVPEISQFVVASELFGRRVVGVAAFSAYLLTFIGQALPHNMETLLVMRFFGGVFGCAPLTTGGGVLADVWDASGRTIPSAIFLTCVFVGPCIATIAGGL